MQKFTFLFAAILLCTTSFAKIWRVNNNAGVTADFTTLNAATSSASVMDGDTLHIEPSATSYSSFTPAKRLVYMGAGYFLNPSDASFPYNAGLQTATASSTISTITLSNSNAAGSKFFGLSFPGGVTIYGNPGAWNLTFEKDYFSSYFYFYENGASLNSDAVTVRKCFFNYYGLIQNGNASASNLTVENCIFYNNYAGIRLPNLSGTNNILRNNSFYEGNGTTTITNTYVANNIFFGSGSNTFTNCTIKNNLFQTAQPLPGTATGNQVSVNMANVYVGGTGSIDSRVMLKQGSPAIGAGVTINGYTPDAGAYGATDPYKLSGIPPVPSIYRLTVPTSIPSGSASMNITFSSRSNN